MREYKALREIEDSGDFDAEVYSEKPMVEVQESGGRIRLVYTFAGFYLSDDNRLIDGSDQPFKQVTIESTGFLAESGKPELPSFGRYVQIPFNCEYKIAVFPGDPVEFDDVLVAPAQVKLTDGIDQEPEFEYDQSSYDSENVFPDEMARVSGPYDMDGYNSILVHVCPFQYNPGKRQLIGYSNIEVTIDIVPKEKESREFPDSNPDNNNEAFGNLFLNPSRNVGERLRVGSRTRPLPFFPILKGPELLIIFSNKFKVAADKLALWKETRGLRTETVAIDRIGNDVGKIKKYIRNRRQPRRLRGSYILPRLRYVLLFGDTDTIVSQSIHNNISDYYYSTKSDPTNSEFLFPWLSIGRIPVDTKEEGMDVVNQIIQYEKDPPGDPDYYRSMTFGAFFQDTEWWEPATSADGRATRKYMKTMEFIREHMISLGFDVERSYVTQYDDPELAEYRDGTTVPEDVKNAIVDGTTATNMLIDATREGRLIIAHRDHGSPDGWSHPEFEQRHLPAAESRMQSIFYSLNCQTGRFDSDPSNCFAEAILAMNGGTPSLIAATRNSHSFLNDDLMKALFDGMWGGVLETFPDSSTASYPIKYNRLGDLLNYGKTYLPIGMAGGTANIQDHFEIYHVIGDPSLELWRHEPTNVHIKATVQHRHLSRAAVLIIRLSSSPQGSVITVWHRKRLIKRVEPRSTLISLPINNLRRLARLDPILVCFKAPGCRFRQVRVRM